MHQHDIRPAANLATTRRSLLGVGAAILPTAFLPEPAAAAECEYERVRRLSRELSAALTQIPEYEYVLVRPDKEDFPILVGYGGITAAHSMAALHLSEFCKVTSRIDTRIKKWRVTQPVEDDPHTSERFVLIGSVS
jgi:hypothetical protein